MYHLGHRSILIASALILLSALILYPGCTINIYFMNTNPAAPADSQSDATRQVPEPELAPAAEDGQMSIAVPPTIAADKAEGKYVGSRNSNRYHLPDCEWAQKISPSNQVWFASAEEALSAGYLPCKVCQPPSE